MSRLCRIEALVASLLFVTHLAVAEVTFSADFESGSIGEVESVASASDTLYYKVRTRLDPVSPILSTESRSSRWFYFRMCGMCGRVVSVEIPDTDVQRPMYSYDNQHFERYSEQDVPERNGRFTKLYERDTVYVAYFTPYTTQRNDEQLNRWEQSPYVRGFVAGHTAAGTPLKAMVVSDNPHDGLIPDGDSRLRPTAEDRAKRVVYIHGRIHPSESPSSWHLEALVDQLLEEGYSDILHNTILYILPITNPDGVYGGYSRTNPRGVNIETNYNSKSGETEAEAAAIKRLIMSLKSSGLQPDILLNMHSQSTPQITYWLHTAASTSRKYNHRIKLFAALSNDSNPHFKWHNQSYSTLKPHFVEGWVANYFKGEYIALTFETPYSFYNRTPSSEWVDLQNLQQQARYTLNAITDMLGVGSADRIVMDELRSSRGFRHSRNKSYHHFGDGYLVAKRGGEELTYRTNAPAGKYNIYRWQVTPNRARGGMSSSGGWQLIGEQTQTQDGELKYKITSTHQGERFDRLQLRLSLF